jgi:predicted site-specific integrase-resolvase
MQPESTAAEGAFLTASELGRLFGVSPKTVYAWGKRKKIAFRKSRSGLFKFSYDHVKKLWEQRFEEGLLDRRGGGQRFRTSLPVRLIVQSLAEQLEAETIDLSPGGLRLKVYHPGLLQELIARGQPVRLGVQGFDAPLFNAPLQGFLRRHENLTDGTMAVGLELDRTAAPQPEAPKRGESPSRAAARAGDEESYTAGQLRQLLRISLPTLFAWVKQGRLTYRKSPGGIFTFSRSQVDRLIAVTGSTGSTVERRKVPRLDIRLPLQLSVSGEEHFTYEALTANISSRGMKLLMKSPYFIKYRMLQGDHCEAVLTGLPPPLFRGCLRGRLQRFEIIDREILGVGIELYET